MSAAILFLAFAEKSLAKSSAKSSAVDCFIIQSVARRGRKEKEYVLQNVQEKPTNCGTKAADVFANDF